MLLAILAVSEKFHQRDTESIKNRVEKEQALRNKKPTDWDAINKLDLGNYRYLKKITGEHGFIDVRRFGLETVKETLLLVQHTPEEYIGFMESYLEFLEKDLDPRLSKKYAYLKDRVNLFKGRSQVYGTQFKTINKNGKNLLVFDALKNPGEVGKRRSEVGFIF